MTVLRVEHPVQSFENWKKAFDDDPLNRKQSGVRRYRILRSVDDPNYVMIDLEFNTKAEAEALLGGLRQMWSQVQGQLMFSPQARIVETVESKELEQIRRLEQGEK